MDTVYLVDANAFCYRAFYAVRDLRTSEGFPTGALFGFAAMLKKLIAEYEPSYIACCFDVSRVSFRSELYAEYKSNRPALDDDLKAQMPFIKQIVQAYRIAVLEKEGFEADDLIASLARQALREGFKTCVVSSDKDLFQLITDDRIVVLDPLKKLSLNEAKFREIYGFPPARAADFIALTGDSVDNIKGAPGVGEKTARDLLILFDSLENLLEHPEKVGKEKIRQSLLVHKERLLQNKQLTTLRDDVAVVENIKALRYQEPDYRKLYELYTRMEFKKLIDSRMKEAMHGSAQPLLAVLEEKTGLPELQKMLARTKEMLFTLEKDRLLVLVQDQVAAVSPETVKEVLEDPGIRKITFDSKQALQSLEQRGIKVAGIFFDLKIAASVVDASCVKLDEPGVYYFFLKEHLPPQAEPYLKGLSGLYNFLKKKLEENEQTGLFYQTEMPLVQVLDCMERRGIKLDLVYLSGLLKEADGLIKKEQKAVFKEAGQDFNLNSPRQIANVLFEKLKLPTASKTKTGYSTNEEVLSSLSEKYAIAAHLLSYRTLSKIKSTYLQPFIEEAGNRNGRIFTHFDQTATNTGRLASHSPNLQNIPAKGAWADKIRRAFVSSFEGGKLVCADYSQIELRILAALSGDEQLKRTFAEEKDVHRVTASTLFHKDEGRISPEEREVAKRINFGIVYGISPYGLSKQISITPEQAETFIQEYFVRYPGVKRYIEQTIEQARKDGYVRTILGRRRSLPHILSPNKNLREFAQRQAVNTPVQGSAAEVIKRAMIRFQQILAEGQYASQLILQIHDELVCDAAAEEEAAVIRGLKNAMENAFTFEVPLKAAVYTGNNWGTMEEVEL